jgi:HK97 gp10 family phage protein
MGFSFSIVRYGDRFWEVERRAKPEAARIASRTAMAAASIARQLCPVDTGELKASIFVEQDGETRFAVGASAPYAVFVEYGTAFSMSQPFINPAIELARQDFERGLAEFFQNVSG